MAGAKELVPIENHELYTNLRYFDFAYPGNELRTQITLRERHKNDTDVELGAAIAAEEERFSRLAREKSPRNERGMAIAKYTAEFLKKLAQAKSRRYDTLLALLKSESGYIPFGGGPGAPPAEEPQRMKSERALQSYIEHRCARSSREAVRTWYARQAKEKNRARSTEMEWGKADRQFAEYAAEYLED